MAVKPTLTKPGAAPLRSAPSTFNALAEQHVAWQAVNVNELAAFIEWANNLSFSLGITGSFDNPLNGLRVVQPNDLLTAHFTWNATSKKITLSDDQKLPGAAKGFLVRNRDTGVLFYGTAFSSSATTTTAQATAMGRLSEVLALDDTDGQVKRVRLSNLAGLINNVPRFEITGLSIGPGDAHAVNHNLGRVASRVRYLLVCQADDAGFTAGEVIDYSVGMHSNAGGNAQGILTRHTTTHVYMTCSAGIRQVMDKTTGASVTIDVTKWRYTAQVWE